VQALTAAELAALAQLRARFLDGSNSGGGYWRTDVELALYDATFAERIGWKWDAVLGELLRRGWKPQAQQVCDFGCGSGIAGRRVLGVWEYFAALTVADVSPLAVRFAETKARTEFPAVAVTGTSAESLTSLAPGTLLLVSHVINELSPAARNQILSLARQAEEIIWVEAGTHADSRALIAVREELRGEFAVIAPCTHAAPCGMLAPENAAHWCHHFGRVPSHVFQDAGWAQFGRELGIDLRSLPYSFLVLSRAPSREAPGAARIIGAPREAKGRMEILGCAESGVAEATLQKRDGPALFKALQKGKAKPVQRWRVVEGKILPEGVGEREK
jgi:ribosomal protein RSM22 (predicted rRNA methylase)